MPRHLCLGCIGAISSDSVTLFVSHCDKLFLIEHCDYPSRSKRDPFKFNFSGCPSYIPMCEKCLGERSSQWGKQETLSCYATRQAHLATVPLRSILQQITNCSTALIVSTFCQVIILGGKNTSHGLFMQVCPGLWHCRKSVILLLAPPYCTFEWCS